MLKVFKYQVEMSDYFELDLPEGARILIVDVQSNIPWLWALVDPSAPSEKRLFRFAGTGHPIEEDPDKLRFISTFKVDEGALIFHIFEVMG